MARRDKNPDTDTAALAELIQELRKNNVSIDELFKADRPGELAETAQRLGFSGFDAALVTKLKALVGDIDVDLDKPLAGDDSEIS